MKTIIIAVIAAFSLACAASISPLPGVNFGFDAQKEGIKLNADIDTAVTGCELAKKVGWEYAINLACKNEAALEADTTE